MTDQRLPTEAEQAAAKRVHLAVLHEMNLAGLEGACVPAVLAGAATAIADVLTAKVGGHSVAPWFEAQAAMVRQMQSGGA